MREGNNILGCFISAGMNDKTAETFNAYIWGDEGLSIQLKALKNETYGIDMDFVLLKFYVNPIPYLLEHLKEIENYRKKEKAIGIPIIVNEDNFFSKTEDERYQVLKDSIIQKLDLLATVVKKKKLDTNMELLKSDVAKVLNEIGNKS